MLAFVIPDPVQKTEDKSMNLAYTYIYRANTTGYISNLCEWKKHPKCK